MNTKKLLYILTLLCLFFLVLIHNVKAGFYDEWAKFFQNDLFDQWNKQTITPDSNIKVADSKSNNDNICFHSEMSIGHENDDVKNLQQFLYDKGFYKEGLITGYFGPLTAKAVMNFQNYYFDEILKPMGLLKATGYVGQATLKKIHELTQCNFERNEISENNTEEDNEIDLTIDVGLPSQESKIINKDTVLKWYRLDRSFIKGCYSDIWDNYCYQNMATLGIDAFKFEPCIKYYIDKQGIKINDFKANFYLSCSACGCEIPDTYVQIEPAYAEKIKLIGFVETPNNSFIPTTTTTKKPFQVVSVIDVPCYVFPHEAYVNEPVHVVSWWDSKKVAKEDQFPSINDVNGEWLFSNGQNIDDVQIINNSMCQNFFWPYSENYSYSNDLISGRLSSIRYSEVDCYAFKKPGDYIYRASYVKDDKYKKITYNYNCEFKVEENPKYKIIFVTKDKYQGDFAWDPRCINDYQIVGNTLCTNQAKEYGLSGEFEAIFDLQKIGGYVYRSAYSLNENKINENIKLYAGRYNVNLVYKNLFCDGRYSKFFNVYNCSFSKSRVIENSMFCQLPSLHTIIPYINAGVWNLKSFYECEQLFSVADCSDAPWTPCGNKPFTSRKDPSSSEKIYGRTLSIPFASCTQKNPWESCTTDRETSEVKCSEEHQLLCAEKKAKTDLERKDQE